MSHIAPRPRGVSVSSSSSPTAAPALRPTVAVPSASLTVPGAMPVSWSAASGASAPAGSKPATPASAPSPSLMQPTHSSRMRATYGFHSIAMERQTRSTSRGGGAGGDASPAPPPSGRSVSTGGLSGSRQGSGGSLQSGGGAAAGGMPGAAAAAAAGAPDAPLSSSPTAELMAPASRYRGLSPTGRNSSPAPQSPFAHRSQTHLPVPKEALSEGQLEDSYIMGELVGRGAFSKVYEGVCRRDRRKVAIKVISRKKLANSQKQLFNEARIMRVVNHPNIVRVYDIYQDADKFYLVMEFVEHGDLSQYLKARGPLPEPEAAALIVQLASGVDYLHHNGIIHRDLKPENVLVGEGPTLKIADFGLSKLLDRDDDQVDERMRTPCGTPMYMAPEVIRRKGYDHTVDLWSLGLFLYIMLCGYPPFREENEAKLFEKIVNADFTFPDKDWRNVSASARDLISRLLVANPSLRYTCSEVIDHPWTSGRQEKRPQPTLIEMMRGFALEAQFKRAVCAVKTLLRIQRYINGVRAAHLVHPSPARSLRLAIRTSSGSSRGPPSSPGSIGTHESSL